MNGIERAWPCVRLPRRQDAALDGDTTFSVSVLLGRRDEPGVELLARQVAAMAAAAGINK